MKKGLSLVCAGVLAGLLLLFLGTGVKSAYHHMGEKDSPRFLEVYPEKAGTKLDRCTLCHSGGEYEQRPGQFVSMGSCQWCHYTYGYDGSGNIVDTLNNYGKDYWLHGRDANAVRAIEHLDSDNDGYSNIDEIRANTFPGDATDYPGKATAPFRVYSRAQLEALPQHTQFMLLNASRSLDRYVEYTGVPIEELLADAGILESATGITVFSPDGWYNYHPLNPDPEGILYHVRGVYPQALYYYDPQADVALNPADGWCSYNAPSTAGRRHLDPIVVPGGLRMLLAVRSEGAWLEPGVLNQDNRLDGEGPFRVVPPQLNPTPPDQSSRAENQNVVWPYNYDWDHNAGSASRSATIIRVEPLPPGTTDIDILEAGWQYVDEAKLIIYGAIAGTPVCDAASLSIQVPCLRVADTKVQIALNYAPQASDPNQLYWKLESILPASGFENASTCATFNEANFSLHFPILDLNGFQLNVTLQYYPNPDDITGIYWKLGPVS